MYLGYCPQLFPPLCSSVFAFSGEQVPRPQLGEDLEHALIQQVGKAWAIRHPLLALSSPPG